MDTFEAAVEFVKAGMISGLLGKPSHGEEDALSFDELAAHWARVVARTKAELDEQLSAVSGAISDIDSQELSTIKAAKSLEQKGIIEVERTTAPDLPGTLSDRHIRAE